MRTAPGPTPRHPSLRTWRPSVVAISTRTLARGRRRWYRLAQDPPECHRFGDKIMRYFNFLERDLRANEIVCPAKPDSTFADRALLRGTAQLEALSRRAMVRSICSYWPSPSCWNTIFPLWSAMYCAGP